MSVIGTAVAFALTAIDFGFFNRVIGLGITEPATEADVEAASAFFGTVGVTQSVIHLAPGARPAELERWLQARGYVSGARWIKCWHDLVDVARPDPLMRIDRIEPDRADEYAGICSSAFGFEAGLHDLAEATVGRAGWAHYVGYEGATPVATGAMRLHAGVAWLGYGSTIESHRGRGWQTAMFRRRLYDAREVGAWLACTETGEETDKLPVNHSLRNMLKTGFQAAYPRRNWVRLPGA